MNISRLKFKRECPALLSLQFFRLLGRVSGYFFYLFSRKNRQRAYLNLSKAFPHFSLKKRRQIVIGSFQNSATVALEMCWLAWRKDALLKCITFRGEEEVFSRLRPGTRRCCVICSPGQLGISDYFPISVVSRSCGGKAF